MTTEPNLEALPDTMLDEATEMELKASFCPCCGQPNRLRRSPEWILLYFSGMVQRILIVLLEKRRVNNSATILELRHACYEGAGLDEPTNANTAIHVTMKDARGRLNSLGWDFVGPKVSGKGYILVPLE